MDTRGSTEVMHSGDGGSRVNLLTQEEAVRLLRLDELDLKRPKETLRYLRRTGQLGYLKVAGKVLVPRAAIEAYLKKQKVEALD